MCTDGLEPFLGAFNKSTVRNARVNNPSIIEALFWLKIDLKSKEVYLYPKGFRIVFRAK